MRVLVTGASGYVGGTITRFLIEAGHEVLTLNRDPAVLPGVAQHVALDLGTIQTASAISESVDRCDAVVHAAALISYDNSLVDLSRVNCGGTQALIQLAAHWSVRRFIYFSSISVIGAPAVIPVDEGHPVNPASAYSATKLFGEHLTNILYNTAGIPALSLRLTSPVGPHMPHNRIFSVFVSRALRGEPLQLVGRGTRRQNYVDVRDAAALVSANLNSDVSGVFNVAGAESISNHALAQLCIDTLGSSSAIEFLDRPDPQDDDNWEISIDKAARLLGYTPQHSLSQSIEAAAQTL